MKNIPNDINADLLLNNPKQFVVENQMVIEFVVGRYVKRGFIHPNNREEVVQHINFRLLNGVITKMQEQYNSSYMLSTYLTNIINNLCKEFLNNEGKLDNNASYEDFAKYKPSSENPGSDLLILEEIKRLEMIFELYYRKKQKLLLTLKIKYKSDISEVDFANLHNSEGFNLAAPMTLSNFELAEKTEAQLFDYYAPYFTGPDFKPVSGASLKRWTYEKIDEIISLLNGEFGRSSYDIETLGILFEKYLEKNSNSDRNSYIYS